MKRALFILFLPAAVFAAVAANDLVFTQRNSGNTAFVQRNVTTSASSLLGTTSGSLPVTISVGTGLSISNNTLSTTGSGSGNVTGSSLTANAVVTGNGTTSIKVSGVTIDASDNIVTSGNFTGNVGTFTTGNFTTGTITTLSATNISGATTNGQLLIGNTTTGNFAKTSVSGDATLAASGAITLATVNTNTGTWGNATQTPAVTVNGKGLITAMSNVTVTPAVGSITGLGTNVATILGNTANTSGGIITGDGSVALTNKTYEGMTVSTTNGTLTIANSKTLTVSANTTLNGASSTGLPDVWVIPIGDETTAITTGTAKVTFRAPYAATVTAVRASLNTASSSGLPTFDINEAGSSILSTKITIDANELTSTTAATAAVISDTAIADDAEITIDIDTAGTGAKGAKIAIYVVR